MRSKITILGHPIHPMLIAYPIAFYTATLACYIIYAANRDPFFYKAAIAANIAGIIMAGVAAIPGVIDWLVGIPGGTTAWSHGLLHMLLNVAAVVLFIINVILHAGTWNSPTRVTVGIILSLLGVLCTVAGGFLGWILIQTDHVGIEPLVE